jgi:hypothetical protein
MVRISYYTKFLTFAKYKEEVLNEINVMISVPVVVVGTYNDPVTCFTDDGNDTVAESPVDINIFVV